MVSTSLFRITGWQLPSSKQEILVCNTTSPDFHGFLCTACILLLLPKYTDKCAKKIVVSGIFCRFGFHKPKHNLTQCSIKQQKKPQYLLCGNIHTTLANSHLSWKPPSFTKPITNGLPGFGTHLLIFNLIVAGQQQLRQGVWLHFLFLSAVSPSSSRG